VRAVAFPNRLTDVPISGRVVAEDANLLVAEGCVENASYFLGHKSGALLLAVSSLATTTDNCFAVVRCANQNLEFVF
jgi:hypothetical protein